MQDVVKLFDVGNQRIERAAPRIELVLREDVRIDAERLQQLWDRPDVDADLPRDLLLRNNLLPSFRPLLQEVENVRLVIYGLGSPPAKGTARQSAASEFGSKEGFTGESLSW
jgi:hypothetical protein